MVNTIYDFTRPRVRKNGRSLDKFSLAKELNKFEPRLNWDIIYDAFSYADLRSRLIKNLL